MILIKPGKTQRGCLTQWFSDWGAVKSYSSLGPIPRDSDSIALGWCQAWVFLHSFPGKISVCCVSSLEILYSCGNK